MPWCCAQLAAVDHLAFHIVAADAHHPQLDQPVRKQNAGAGFDFLRQPPKGRRDQARGTFNVSRRDGDLRSGCEHNRSPALQPAGANLGALQVLQNADGAILLLRRRAAGARC